MWAGSACLGRQQLQALPIRLGRSDRGGVLHSYLHAAHRAASGLCVGLSAAPASAGACGIPQESQASTPGPQWWWRVDPPNSVTPNTISWQEAQQV